MKQITKEERNVLLAIIHAETGSDSGKGFHNLYGKSDARNRKAVRMGYANKLSYILAAINTLRGIRGGSKVINTGLSPVAILPISTSYWSPMPESSRDSRSVSTLRITFQDVRSCINLPVPVARRYGPENAVAQLELAVSSAST